MLDFFNKLFKSKDTSEPAIDAQPQPKQVQAVHPENKQKFNVKLGVYDTPLFGCNQTVLHGAGMEYYMDALMELATENLDYTCTKSEMKK